MENFEVNNYGGFSHLSEDLIYQQITQFAEYVVQALPKGADETKAISAQVEKMKNRSQSWPDKIMACWLERVIPLFTQESILKQIQAYLSWTDGINENRKRHRETLKMDINRCKKLIDNINSNRLSQQDEFNRSHLTTQAEMSWYSSNEREYALLERRLQAQTQAHQTAYDRLRHHEIQILDLERDYVPIRYVSNQSKQKGHIIKKQHLDRYLVIQNTTCPNEPEIIRHISWEPETQLTNLPLSVYNLIHYADKIGAPTKSSCK